MYKFEEFKVIYVGNVSQFEEEILFKSEQEIRKGVLVNGVN